MNIWCDVCSKKKASVFCSADEAALCDECDSRVHQANKLASKHQRLSLLQSSSKHTPLCDICQGKKALLFCQQDRAILCIDCDGSIHTANELTMKHNRFLLTGVKLTSLVSKTQAKVDSASHVTAASVPDFRPQSLTTKSQLLNLKPQSSAHSTNGLTNDVNGGTTSSISEYLIDILPGWQVEDLLDSSSDPLGFSKGSENGMLFMESNLESNMGIWVPQVSQASPFNWGIHGLEMGKGELGRKVSRKRADDGFTVPEINQQFLSSKRSRAFF